MSAAAELPGFRPGRETERDEVVAYILERGVAARRIGDKGHRITEADGKRLDRWLRALADDIRAELHVNE